jgi:metal transporter CNNM
MSPLGLALPSALLNLLFLQALIWQFSALANYGWRSRRQVVTAMHSDCLLCAKISNLTLATVLWGNVTINVLLTLLSDSVLAGLGAFAFSTRDAQ